jgi:hypothetical protein
MSLVVRFPDSLRREREYAAHVVLDVHLGVEHEVIFENRRDVEIHAAGDLHTTLRIPDIVFAAGDQDWPASAVRPPPVEDVSRFATGRGEKFAADVFGTTFWYLTRLEEILAGERDAHGRFPAAASRDSNQTPCVDELIDRFGRRLLELWPSLLLRTHKFELAPTHDVDRPFKHLYQSPSALLRGMARDAFRRGNLGAAVRSPALRGRVRRGLLQRDPFNTFDWLMDESESAGLRSTFYFLCSAGAGGVDGDYRLQDPAIRALLRRIHERNHAIGLHGSYASAYDSEILGREIQTLRATCESEGIHLERIRARQHVLRYDPRTTPGVWARAGVDEDSTLGHAGLAGFRCGTSRAFPLFDSVARSMTKVIERPLIVMDTTLFEERYENLAPAAALARIELLAQRCRATGGAFVALWHNCGFEEPRARELYSAAIRAVSRPDRAAPAVAVQHG